MRKVKRRYKLKGRTQRINGIPVINAKRPLSLDISDNDIAAGVRKSPSDCAAAAAIKRQVEGCTDARVHSHVTYVLAKRNNKEVYERYKTPEALRFEALSFDRGGTMVPDHYALPVMTPRKAPTGRRQGSSAPGARDAGSKDRTPSFKRQPHFRANVRPTARAKEDDHGKRRGSRPGRRRVG